MLYGRYSQPTRDWVYLLTENFPGLEEGTFAIDRKRGGMEPEHMCFGNWWGCVRDAVREGLGYASGEREGRGKRVVRLRVEDGDWGVEEMISC